MKVIEQPIKKEELKPLSNQDFGGLVKCVVDIRKKIMAIDASMHADEETFLLEKK
jgi:hypothetical protein